MHNSELRTPIKNLLHSGGKRKKVPIAFTLNIYQYGKTKEKYFLIFILYTKGSQPQLKLRFFKECLRQELLSPAHWHFLRARQQDVVGTEACTARITTARVERAYN